MLAALKALGIGLLSTFVLFSGEPPELGREWSGDDWGSVILKQGAPGKYTGTFSDNLSTQPGEIQLNWSRVENRFNGTWREGEDRFGELSLRLVGNEVRGAYTTDPASKINPATPHLADVAWVRGAPLNLTKVYHTPAYIFAKETKYPWPAVPHGKQTFCNVPLAIDGRICLWGDTNAQRGLVFPKRVDDIPVNRKIGTLYVYHATFHTSASGAPVYDLNLHYADGTSSTTTLCYGTHLLDWYRRSDHEITEITDVNSKLAWQGDPTENTANRPDKLRFFITAISNPKPAQEVKTISVVSSNGSSAACILAMTTGPADLLKTDNSTGNTELKKATLSSPAP